MGAEWGGTGGGRAGGGGRTGSGGREFGTSWRLPTGSLLTAENQKSSVQMTILKIILQLTNAWKITNLQL